MAPSRRKGANKAAAAAAARRQWKIGDLVLAKVKGFPAWPATVSEPEKWGYSADWKKVLVYFFGTQQIAFCNPADVEAFTEEKKESLLGKRHGKGADFVRAVHEIIESYEKMKTQDHTNNANTTAEHSPVTENNSGELLVKSFGSGDAPVTSQSRERKTHYVAEEDDVNAKSDIAAAVSGRDMQEKEDSSSLLVTETALTNVDSPRENSERTVAPKYFTRRRPTSARRARSASRTVPNGIQTRTTRSGTIAPSIVRDGPGRRNKRIRKSPDDFYERDVDSPDLVSNGSIEGNDSEIMTANSDSLSLNEGSTVESECKTAIPDSTSELCPRNVELSQRLDFQTNGISKKKRMPNRKRPSSDAVEFTTKPDKKTASDADAVKSEHILPGDQEISTERFPKEDGDEHLPLVKRARVRMGRILSTGEQTETSLDTEEKLPEVCSSVSDHVHVSSDREGDDSTDRNPFSVKGDLENSSQSDKHQTIKHQVWEVRKYQHLGSSVEGEAALPPSKRLHRALEAMSANAAEDHQMGSDAPSTTKVDTSGCCSPSSDDYSKSYLERKLDNELDNGIAEENFSNIKPQDRASECSLKLDPPFKEERASSGEIATCCSDESTQQKSREDNEDSFDDKHVLKSSSNDHVGSVVVVKSSESLSPRGANISMCSPGVGLPSIDDCISGSSKLAKISENDDHRTNHLAGDSHTIHSPYSGMNIETDRAGEECERSVNLHKLAPDESKLSNGTSKNVGEIGPAMEDSSGDLCPVSAEVMSNNIVNHDQSHSRSAANDHLGDKTTSGTKSSPSPTYKLDTITLVKPHTSTCNKSTSVNSSIHVDTARSPVPHIHHDIQRSAGKWNYKEANDALASFEGYLGTLTRTKESIGRATRSAIDCAKFGVAAKVVEILAHSLEREAGLHRRVDLFFLVDSIAQCSRGLKGDVGGVYPSAILAVLPRLLSAAAPPGSNSQENRRQCLKVLRVWQERRILPESIVRHHIRELDSLCGSSCSRTLSRRLRNERAFDDPIREMEGMLVDEYGSNSSIQLPGFRMPPMLRDEDDGIDSDGESFEAVTPEHEAEKTEVERNIIPAVEKHRHILEDVDGELEMEDVAPPSEAVISSSDSAATNNVQTTHHSVGNAVTVPFAPPLPRDVPPMSPPLPKSPPPPPSHAPRASFPLPSEMPDNLSSSVGSKVYISSQNIEDDLRESSGQQSNAPGVNTISDAVQSSRPGHIEFHSQVPKQLPNSTLSSRPISNPPVRGVNNIPPSDGAFNKGFRLRPPHPAPSNQFSYVQADRRVQSRRDIPPPSHPTRFHVQNTENGNFYRETDRMKLAPHDTGEHWRAPPFPGPRYPDGSRMPYTPATYAGQPGESTIHGNHWAFPHGAMNHRGVMPHRPPAGGTIPVAARGPNCWRPR